MSIIKAAVMISSLALASVCNGQEAMRADIWGFSEDGTTFAFETFDDNSCCIGYAESNIYFIDVASDTYAHLPVRVNVNEDTGGLVDLETAREFAKTLASEQGLGPDKFRLDFKDLIFWAAANSNALPHDIALSQEQSLQVFVEPNRWTFDTHLVPASEVTEQDCPFSQPVIINTLWASNDKSGQQWKLYADANTRPPKSRLCATQYAIQAIIKAPDQDRLVFLLRHWYGGFEGGNYFGYMAIATDLPQ